MSEDIKALGIVHTAPGTRTRSSRKADYTMMSNDALKFALDVLSLHNADTTEALTEIAKRIERGQWLDIEQPIKPVHNVPAWLHVWPFCLLWAQRPK